MSNNDFLVLKNITKAFGKAVVIDNLDLTIKRGTMVTLLGPSGCGKTTVLRLVAGLENPTSGQIFIDGVISCIQIVACEGGSHDCRGLHCDAGDVVRCM